LLIEQRIGYDAITNLTPLADGKANLTEITLDASSPAAGKVIQDLALPESCLIVSVMRDGQVLIPRGGTQLLPRDRIGIVSLPEVYPRVLAVLTGDTGI
jgi:trk system potassium uptake protein TrkA